MFAETTTMYDDAAIAKRIQQMNPFKEFNTFYILCQARYF